MNFGVNARTIYERAPMTASTAEFLSKAYGYAGIADFATSLPSAANILDVGAGASEFGKVITKLRPDITWTNLDINYTPFEMQRLSNGVPKNLIYIFGDILNKSTLPNEKFDLISAFWVLPHIGLEDEALVRKAILNLVSLLKTYTTSKLILGPLINKRNQKRSTHYLTTELSHKPSSARLEMAVHGSLLSRDAAISTRAMNKAGLTMLKNGQRTGQTPTKLALWDYKNRRYIKVLTPRGMLLIIRFGYYLSIEKIKTIREPMAD